MMAGAIDFVCARARETSSCERGLIDYRCVFELRAVLRKPELARALRMRKQPRFRQCYGVGHAGGMIRLLGMGGRR